MSLITNLIDKVSELIKLKLDQAKIEVQGQVALVLSRLIFIFAIGLLLTFTLFFFGIALAYVINHATGSYYLGFLIVGAIALICSILLILLARSEAFKKALKNRLLEND